MYSATCSLFLFLALFPSARGGGIEAAADPDVDAIRKQAERIIEHVRKQDWDHYAALIHPDSLKAFKEELTPVLKSAQQKGGPSQTAALQSFDGAKDIPSLLDMEPREFLARYLKGLHFPRSPYSYAASCSSRSASSRNLCFLGLPHKPTWIS